MTDPKKKGLSRQAYEELKPGEKYEPYIPASQTPRELTARSLITGVVLGILFGTANAYLGLRVGLTIGSAIPIAVLTVLAFMVTPPFRKKTWILEANVSETIGSVSSSLASGMIFTIPALFLWGKNPSVAKVVAISVAGGLLGVLFMIPLRRFLIRDEHGKLPYPESMACGELLVAADRGGSGSLPIFRGILAGALLKFLGSGLNLWKSVFSFKVPFLPRAEVGMEIGPALLGVGYIVGFRPATVMVAGAAISSLILIPVLYLWGQGFDAPIYPEAEKLIRDMTTEELWKRYIRYVGAGAVACAGFISLARSLPTIWASFRVGVAQLRKKAAGIVETEERTNQDLSIATVLGGVALVVILLASTPFILGFLPSLGARIVSAGVLAVLAFFFVTVASRITGLVGVTSNPTSGMTIAALLIASGVFLLFGWTGPEGMAQALVIGAVVCTAASVGGDISQDLKIGFLLGTTPRKQQIGQIIGIAVSATFVVLALFALEKEYHFGSKELPAPQATLMKLVVEGVMSRSIPWAFVMVGAALAGIAAVFRLPVLAFAVGIYLPISTMAPVFIGGLLRKWVEYRSRGDEELTGQRREKGILFGSGLVGGEGLVGVGIAVFALVMGRRAEGFGADWAGALVEWVPFAVFALMAWLLYRETRIRKAG